MKSVLLAGLSDHDAAALELLISLSWRDKRCMLAKRKADFSLPVQNAAAAACEQVVVDLSGVGLHHCTAENAERLLDFLAGRPALLLLRKGDARWQQWAAQEAVSRTGRQPVVVLAAPYRSSAANAALAQLDAERGKPGYPSGALPSVLPATLLPGQTAKKVLGGKPFFSAQSAAALARLELAQVLPLMQRSHFLRLAQNLPRAQACWLHIGAASFLLHAKEGWAAAAMPISAMLKVLGQAEQLASAAVQPLASSAGEEGEDGSSLSGKSTRAKMALDGLLWELCSRDWHGLGANARSPRLQQDALLHLERLPNFSCLTQVDALDMPLALRCLRQPQRLSGLLAAYSGQQAQVLRFVALAVLAGLADLRVPPPEHAAGLLKPGGARAATGKSGESLERREGHESSVGEAPCPALLRERKERRGFLRAFLDRLF